MTQVRILVVEDDRVVVRDIKQQLIRVGYAVVGTTPRGEDVMSLALETRPDLVLMDIRLEGGVDGIDAAQQIRERLQIPVIYLTAYADEPTLQRAKVTDPFGYLLKPFEDSQLRTAIEMAMHKHATERQLRASERRYAVTLSSIGDAVIATDDQARITFMNPVAEALTGWPLADALGRPLSEVFRLLHEQSRPVEEPAAKVRRQGALVGLTNHTVLLARDGREIAIDDSRSPIIDDRGGSTGEVLIFRDLAQRRRAEEADALERLNARLEMAVRGSKVSIWDVELPHGTVEGAKMYTVNAWEPLGYPESEAPLSFSGRREQWHPADRERVDAAISASVKGGAPLEIDFRVRHRDGSYRTLLSRGIVVRAADGTPIRFVGSNVDISDLKQLEEQLRQATAVAEAANRAKDEFLANVSHEIRTPMNAILGMTELTLDTPLAEDQRQSLRTVKSAAGSLLAIINDLLDFSKIEAGKLDLDPADFFLRAALGDTLRALATRAHRKGLELVCNVQPDVPDALIGDAGRLRQVLINLVGNAIKFTTEGEVVVQVSVAREPERAGEVAIDFTVRDTGIGIHRDKHAMIFRAFEQEDTSTTRRYGGTGLGLTIAARLVAMMGGQLTVESASSQGSTFMFTARFGRQLDPGDVINARPPVLLRHLRVLIVDDNAVNRHILEEWLLGWQMDPTAVGDGVAAMDSLWHGVASGRPYPLVLLDARMPDTDGLTLTAKIRERTELSASRIILLTSGDRPGELARFRELRVNAHLLKPVPREELLETIHQVMSRGEGDAPPSVWSAAAQPSGPASPAPVIPLRVVVAEDNDFSSQLLHQLLVRRGHHVRVASNGREALNLIREGGFDLVLLDLHMPELDGFQVIRAVREGEASRGGHLPVIALTARSRAEDRARCLAAGMDYFLAKPIQAAELWDAIDRVVEARAPIGRRTMGLVSARVLLAACGGDAVILQKITEALRQRLPGDLAAVEGAFRDRDALRLREAAHTLSGMAAAFSSLAGDVASDLEDVAARGHLDEAEALISRLRTLAPDLLDEVGALSLEALQRAADGEESGARQASLEAL
jgi:two-component system, sensor histidine kinase and response regulator